MSFRGIRSDQRDNESVVDSDEDGDFHTSDDESEDDWYEWRMLEENTSSDVVVKFDPLEQSALEIAEEEVPILLSRIRNAVGLRANQPLRIRHVLSYWIQPYLSYVQKHTSMVLARNANHAPSSKQVKNFLRTEVAVLVYQKSPTVLFNTTSQDEWFQTMCCRPSEYFKILGALDQPMHPHTNFNVDEGLVEGERMLQNLGRIAHVPERAIIALDDEKMPISKSKCSMYGFVRKKIGKGFCPVQHSLVSVGYYYY